MDLKSLITLISITIPKRMKPLDRSTKPRKSNYIDPSWIGQDLHQAVSLIPRMRGFLTNSSTASWLKFSLSEYSWCSNEIDISAGMSQAEVLAILGREGVDLASRWVAPVRGQCVEAAFGMYLDYDGSGKGSVLGGTSVLANCSVDPNEMSSYAIEHAQDGKLFVIVLNKDANQVTHQIQVTVQGTVLASAPVQHYSLTGNCTHPMDRQADITLNGNVFSTTLAVWSINLFVVPIPVNRALSGLEE